MTDGLARILGETVEGPLQKVFAAIDERFEDMLGRIEELERSNDDSRAAQRVLQRDKDELASKVQPLADELEHVSEENRRLRRSLEAEAATRQVTNCASRTAGILLHRPRWSRVGRRRDNGMRRQDELEEVNGVMRQMALAIDRIGDEADSVRAIDESIGELRKQVESHAGDHPPTSSTRCSAVDLPACRPLLPCSHCPTSAFTLVRADRADIQEGSSSHGSSSRR